MDILSLPAAVSTSGSDLLLIVQGGVAKNVTLTILLAGIQGANADLAALAALGTTGAMERTGAGTFSTFTVTNAGKTLIACANVALMRTALGLGGAALLNVGTAPGTVAAGDDARLTNARTPTSHTHTKSQITDFPAVGTGAGTIAAGDDSRLSNARTPTSHTHTLSQITDAGTAATLNFPASGNAGSGEAVKGSDTRLTNSRTPTTHAHTLADISNAGGAAALEVGVIANTVAAGDDSRLTGPRAPSAHTHTRADLSDLAAYISAFLGAGTAAALAAAIADKTGTGNLVFASGATLIAPVLGAATATSINGLTVSRGLAAIASNAALGFSALGSTTSGYGNTAIGHSAGTVLSTGSRNTALGYLALSGCTTGQDNVALGYNCLVSNVSGGSNVAIGTFALNANTGSGSIGIGPFAGAYSTAGNEIYFDNRDRGSTAADKANAIIWGLMAGSAGAQTLTINAGTITLNGAVTVGSLAVLGGLGGAIAATTLSASGNVTLSPTGTVAISPTGTVTISPTGAITINPSAASTINNCSIGATVAAPGKFTTVETTGAITVNGTARLPATQPARVGPGSAQAQTALTDSTGGTASSTLAAITAGAAYSQADLVAVKNALSSLAAKLALAKADFAALLTSHNALEAVLSAAGGGTGITA